jgi:FHA domain
VSENAPSKFVPMKVLVEAFLTMDRDAYMGEWPGPFLLLDQVEGSDGEAAQFQTIESAGTGTSTLLARVEHQAKWVFQLVPKDEKFASMLTVGRSAGNDVRINVPSLSKFHAYFTHVAKEGAWYISDANSSNGTYIDGEELPPSHGKVKLESGTFIRFGPDVVAKFYDGQALWEFLQSHNKGDASETS